jgi:hypothetical protein
MAIDVQQLTQQMLTAAIPVLRKGSPNAEPLAALEFTKLAHTIAFAHAQLEAHQLTPDEGAAFLDQQKSASRSILTGLPGLSLLTAGQAINAAFGAAQKNVAPPAVPGIVGPWPP